MQNKWQSVPHKGPYTAKYGSFTDACNNQGCKYCFCVAEALWFRGLSVAVQSPIPIEAAVCSINSPMRGNGDFH